MSKLDQALFWVLGYPFGWLVGISCWVLERLGILKIINKQYLPPIEENFILIANHPSLLEPVLLYGLFFKRYALRSKYLPLSVPDNTNYIERWFWWRPFRKIFIPVSRGAAGEGMAFRQMKKALDAGRSLIVFPEGGRTFKGEAALNSLQGKSIRQFKVGVARLAYVARVKVLPVWVEGSDRVVPYGKIFPRWWRPMIIKLGPPLMAPVSDGSCRPNYEAFNQQLMQAVIRLADS